MFTNLQYESLNPTLCRIEYIGDRRFVTDLNITEVVKKDFRSFQSEQFKRFISKTDDFAKLRNRH